MSLSLGPSNVSVLLDTEELISLEVCVTGMLWDANLSWYFFNFLSTVPI